MIRSDTYTPDEPCRERMDCHNRASGAEETCPERGGELRNIPVPRE